MATEMSMVYMPPGWRTSVTSDGRLFYINDITKTTQWNPPPLTVPQTVPQTVQNPPPFAQETVPTAVSDAPQHAPQFTMPAKIPDVVADAAQKEESEESGTKGMIEKCKKIPWKVVIFIVGFIITINDFVSDIQVSAALTDISESSFCSQFHCATADGGSINQSFAGQARILLIVAFIGFGADLIFKLLKARTVFYIYKYPEQDNAKRTFEDERRELKWGWITLIVEDFVSILILLIVSRETQDIVGLARIYVRSIVFSLLSLTKSLLSSWYVRHKMNKSKERYYDENAFSVAKKYHKRWSYCLAIIMVLALGNLIAIALYSEPQPWIDLYSPNSNVKTTHYINMTCTESQIDTYIGNLKSAPDFVYENCKGLNYRYSLNCDLNTDSDIYVLNCMLEWEYNDYFRNECDNANNDYCSFDIYSGVCNYYAVQCDNGFSFYSGDPEMWTCIDYCTKTI